MVFTMIFTKDDGLKGRESTIPVLDLRDYFKEEKKEAFLQEVREAAQKVGFFAVKNTGVDQSIIDKLYSSLEEFYALDMPSKMEVVSTKTGGQRGYMPFGGEAAKGSKFGDYKEFYMMGREISSEEAINRGYPANTWPTTMDLKGPAIAFYNQLEVFSRLFQEIFSLALYQEVDFLHKIHKDGDTSCRMIHYPMMENQQEGVIWAKGHTDITSFTILPRATCEGLEVMDDSGSWIPVFVKEDAMIINIGDFLEIFSNGHFKSSMHRVKSPKNMKKDRYSCVHFVHPLHDAMLYPLPIWIERSGGEQKFARATRNEMLFERLADLGYATPFMLEFLAKNKVMERLMEYDRASPEAMRMLYDAKLASNAVKEALNKNFLKDKLD